MKPDGCRCEGEEHKNPRCFVTERTGLSIRERMLAVGIVGNNSDLMVHALLDMIERLRESKASP